MTEQLHFSFSLSCTGEGHGNPLQCSCLENPRDGRAWWAAVYGVTQSRTQLSSSSRCKLLHTEWTNKVLLYSTGNYIWYPGINHNWKEHEKEWIDAYNWMTLLYNRNYYGKSTMLKENHQAEFGNLCFMKKFLSFTGHPNGSVTFTKCYSVWVSESCSVMSFSLRPPWTIHSMEFSRPEYWSR